MPRKDKYFRYEVYAESFSVLEVFARSREEAMKVAGKAEILDWEPVSVGEIELKHVERNQYDKGSTQYSQRHIERRVARNKDAGV